MTERETERRHYRRFIIPIQQLLFTLYTLKPTVQYNIIMIVYTVQYSQYRGQIFLYSLGDWHYVNIVYHCYWKKSEKEVVVVRGKERVREGDKMIMRTRQGLLLMNDFIVQ